MRAAAFALLIAALDAAEPAAADETTTQVRTYLAQHEKDIVGMLAELVRFPSVAANPGGIQAAADRLQAWLKARRFQTEQLAVAPGTPPIVFGSLTVPGAKRTVVFYAHYDGQPVTPS